MIELTDIEILNRILEDGLITPVYQPIVSLSNGKIFGYEALSRVLESKDSDKIVKFDIEYLFKMAHRMNKSWELESLCREKMLEHVKSIINTEKKLFINVNPNAIHGIDFKKGFTKKRLSEYGLNSSNIVFEITEYAAITDKSSFLESISHYRNQNYLIAIDDVGSGYSALDLINSTKPDIIKLDLNLIRDIDKDVTKQFLCKAMIDFGNNAGIMVIAEGIETEEELRTLIKLNVGFGQGYFMSVPCKSFVEIDPEKVNIIKKHHSRKFEETFYGPFSLTIGYLAKAAAIASYKNAEILVVPYRMSIVQATKLAMQRPSEQLYSPIVVEQDGEYKGIVTIKDLLEAYAKIEIDAAGFFIKQ